MEFTSGTNKSWIAEKDVLLTNKMVLEPISSSLCSTVMEPQDAVGGNQGATDGACEGCI